MNAGKNAEVALGQVLLRRIKYFFVYYMLQQQHSSEGTGLLIRYWGLHCLDCTRRLLSTTVPMSPMLIIPW